MTGLRTVLLVWIGSVTLVAQAPMRFTSGTAAVRVDVLVTDKNRPVTGLKASDFELRDNGVVQQISDVSQESLPLNLFCLLDLSGSVEGQPLARLKEATAAVFGSLRDRDRSALMTFADRLILHSPLTGDARRLRGLLDKLEAGGMTSFVDATYAGLALRETDDARAVMLLFSDGKDTSSWLRAETVLEAARRTDVVIYPVTLKPVLTAVLGATAGAPFSRRVVSVIRPDETGENLLEALADETGGRVLYAENDDKLKTTFVQVLSEFRQRYVLSYTPTLVPQKGWHSVAVKVLTRPAQVKARRGYAAEL